MTLEKIVRPFQTRDITPPKRMLTAYEVDAPIVKLEFGKGGSGRTMSGSGSITITKHMDSKFKEQKTADT